ncbi:MAG TPA: O-antigen ligase family protein [Candidatus Sumerlaeota bacterium]|nr:O-antigen ligase family protein [Candidatus Sumerlaeota bacterium]
MPSVDLSSSGPASAGEAPGRRSAALSRQLLGLALVAAGGLTVFLFLWLPFLGAPLAAAWAGLALLLLANRYPQALLIGLVAVAPFNYGKPFAGASIKLSELIALAMLALILLRLAAGEVERWARLRRAWAPVAAMGVLAVLAFATAAPHPNVFNARYELWNYIACAYAILFFRPRHWPQLVGAFVALAGVEAAAALVLYFGFGVTGTSFFSDEAAVRLIRYTAEDIESFAGGMFRLSGTMGHKNLLAAFYVLILPVVVIQMFRRYRPYWLLAIIPGLVVVGLSDSMTGWGAILLIVVLGLLHLRRFDYLALATLLILPLAGAAVYRFGDTIFYRIEQLLSGEEGWGTVSSRFEILEVTLRLLGDYTWSGIGRNNFTAYGETYYGHGHNLYLMKMVEMGVPAGLAFILFILAAIGRAWRPILFEARRLGRQQQYYRALGLWLGCVGFLAMNLFDYNYAHFSLGPLFMMNIGVLLAVAYDFDGERHVGGRDCALSHAAG